jgi:hypothetical protein
MNWELAIQNNRKQLLIVAAQIYAMLNLVAGTVLETLPSTLFHKAERLLRPAESALRRLIVIAAERLIVKPAPSSPRQMPKDLLRSSTPKTRMAFQLYDTPKHYDFIKTERIVTGDIIHIKTHAQNPYNLFDDMYWPMPDGPKGLISAAKLCRRLSAFSYALDHISAQARRLHRWQARRDKMISPKISTPLRPGRPPGHRDSPILPVDFILKDCHALTLPSYPMDSS